MKTGHLRFLGLVIALSALLPSAIACAKPSVVQSTSHHATGVIRSFGPNRQYANIAHDEIPGYMMAMTMSFECGRSGQLDGFAANDRVAFDFVEEADGRRVLSSITRAP